MRPVKKIEIITDSLETEAVVKLLDGMGVSGYTIIRDVTGKGERGLRDGQDLTSVFKNSYIIIACTDEQATGIVEGIRPILKRFGGVCLVSDVLWIIH